MYGAMPCRPASCLVWKASDYGDDGADVILPGDDPAAQAEAARTLKTGGLLGLPTETVYGLAADAGNDQAVAAIFTTKGRPSDHPLIVHVATPGDAARFASDIPDFAQALMQAFWPGPLTLILPRQPHMAVAATGGQNSVGLRCPAHPVAQAVLQAAAKLGVMGVAAPSANRFGRVSPTTAGHVEAEFGHSLLTLDGGACDIGIESTIVDCTRGRPVLLRPGMVGRHAIEQACGQPLTVSEALSSLAPKASGTLEAHYAPNAKVRLMNSAELQAALDLLGQQGRDIAIYARTGLRYTGSGCQVHRMPLEAAAAAQALFADLRMMDATGVKLIWVETPENTPEWEGVHDRLKRASAA